jgi:hypothetical protein
MNGRGKALRWADKRLAHLEGVIRETAARLAGIQKDAPAEVWRAECEAIVSDLSREQDSWEGINDNHNDDGNN